MAGQSSTTPIYFMSLELENVRCFGGKQVLDLSDGNGNPAQWTLLLGDNGVGKSTLLQCLAWMRPVLEAGPNQGNMKVDEETGEPAPVKKGQLGPALPNEENDVLEGLLRIGSKDDLELKATLCVNKAFGAVSRNHKYLSRDKPKKIRTGIKLIYKKGILADIEPLGNTKVETLGEWRREPLIVTYGANRLLGLQNISNSELDDPVASRLSDRTELYDAGEILKELDYAAAKKKYRGAENNRLKKLKQVLAKVLPDVKSARAIKIHGPEFFDIPTALTGIRIETFSGPVPLSALSLGYQTTLAWTVDLAWRLFRHYPKSNNPLEEPAVVLIDEIDLHLHPLWQRTIVDNLTQLFPKTQFIATAHSPLMVQVSVTENLAVLKKEEGQVVIKNDPDLVKSWRVDQILTSELFSYPSLRDQQTEKLFRQRDALLAKSSRSASEEARLRRLEKKIASLDTAEDQEDLKAMELIRKAAALIKRDKHG